MPAAIPTRSPSQSRLGRWPTLCTVFSMLHFADIVRQSQACAASWCLAVRLFQVAAVVVVSLSVGLFPLYQPAPVSDPCNPLHTRGKRVSQSVDRRLGRADGLVKAGVTPTRTRAPAAEVRCAALPAAGSGGRRFLTEWPRFLTLASEFYYFATHSL